jgi:hypothetical protein
LLAARRRRFAGRPRRRSAAWRCGGRDV